MQTVGYAGREGRFGADDDEIDRVFLGENRHRIAVENVDIRAFGDGGNPGVAGGDDQPVAFGILLHGPGDGVFPPAASQD